MTGGRYGAVMRMGIIADIHGNDVALRAVLQDAELLAVDSWWVLGDLVLPGPRPAEVLDLLLGLPDIRMLQGNSDRYVLTDEQPAPHATATEAAASIDLVERYGAMAAGIGWTQRIEVHHCSVRNPWKFNRPEDFFRNRRA